MGHRYPPQIDEEAGEPRVTPPPSTTPRGWSFLGFGVVFWLFVGLVSTTMMGIVLVVLASVIVARQGNTVKCKEITMTDSPRFGTVNEELGAAFVAGFAGKPLTPCIEFCMRETCDNPEDCHGVCKISYMECAQECENCISNVWTRPPSCVIDCERMFGFNKAH